MSELRGVVYMIKRRGHVSLLDCVNQLRVFCTYLCFLYLRLSMFDVCLFMFFGFLKYLLTAMVNKDV